ncbi:JNK-interacting protein Aplip1 isoform X2 [Lycorma delicatula]|uniref:JNK-interacting protein Aplip1 isoform X2 n=1 Tax=Lycorma delicatula TaxID=130591 RepID=UPI003F50F473
MADTEFEEFRDHFETLPQHIKAPTQCYTLVHDVVLDDDSPKDDISDDHCNILSSASGNLVVQNNEDFDNEDEGVEKSFNNGSGPSSLQSQPNSISSTVSDDDVMIKNTSTILSSNNNNKCCNNSDTTLSQIRGNHHYHHHHHHHHHNNNNNHSNRHYYCQNASTSAEDEDYFSTDHSQGSERPSVSSGSVLSERRRRRLPELPKKKHFSLAEELGDTMMSSHSHMVQCRPQSLLMLKCHSYLRNEDSSPEVDSGNSTAHSPDGPKSASPQTTIHNGSVTPSSASSSGSLPFTQLELLEATHRGLYKFIPRHRDELEVEIGDPIYVQKEADDLWCEGVNLRSGQQGIFPAAYVVDVEYNDFDPSTPNVKRERFLLGYLGSVETLCHKGNAVLCQAVKKIVSGTKDHRPHSCILEVSDQGLRMVDKTKPKQSGILTGGAPCHDYFYSLKNVSFCGFHPGDHRYLGFITKHPHFQRFACHVFLGCESTRPVAESVGRAFQRFYTKFIETAYPIEDIYIE